MIRMSFCFPFCSVFQYYSGIEGAKGVPYVNLTEPALLSACNVTNPGTCKTQLTVTVTTEASLGAADCSNYNMQNAWFFSNTPLICRRANNGLFNNSDDGTLPNVNNIKTVSVISLYSSLSLFPAYLLSASSPLHNLLSLNLLPLSLPLYSTRSATMMIVVRSLLTGCGVQSAATNLAQNRLPLTSHK